MSSKISSRLTRQYTAGGGFQIPQTSRTGRGLAPLFADNFQSLIVTGIENVTITIATPSLAGGATALVNGSQGLQNINGVSLTSADVGQLHIGNVSVGPPAGLIVGHPGMSIATAQGTPVIGSLAQGQTYSGLALAVSAQIFAPSAVGAGTLTITATVMLLGTALGN